MSSEDDVRQIERLRIELAQAREELSEALREHDALTVQLDEALPLIEELRRERTRLRGDSVFLTKERDAALREAKQVESVIDEDHQRTIATMLEAHERAISKVVTERDGAVVEAERATEEAKRAFERADSVRRELLLERKRLDRLLHASNEKEERLATERDLALSQVDDLAAMHTAAEEEILRVGEQFMAVEADKQKQLAKLTDLQDKFIEELLEGHEKDLGALSKQRDEARGQLDSLAGQVARAKTDADDAVKTLGDQRQTAARLAAEREAAALELDALAKEREAATRQTAQVMAEQDKFISDLVDSHERELVSALRQRDFAQQQAKDAERDSAELKEAMARIVEERDQLARAQEGVVEENKRAMARVLHEADQRMKNLAADTAALEVANAELRRQRDEEAEQARRDIADLKATIARLLGDRNEPTDLEDGDVVAFRATILRLAKQRDQISQDAERDIADLKSTIARLIEEREAQREDAERDIADLKATIVRLLDSD